MQRLGFRHLSLFFLAFWTAPVMADIKLAPWLSGLSKPTDLRFIADSPFALVTEKGGELVWIDTRSKKTGTLHEFDVKTSSELGLLAVAVSPNFTKDQTLYLYLSPGSGNARTQLLRAKVSDLNLAKAKLTVEKVLLELDQPYNNHNGGGLAFDNQGHLYLGLGDGGSAYDPLRAGQDLKTWQGKILRITPDASDPKGYVIPAGNYRDFHKKARPEIFAIGIRNAWRISFSNANDFFIADVGQDKWEEVNWVASDVLGQAPLNFGWSVQEGLVCFRDSKCAKQKYHQPKWVYGRGWGRSITGGYSYEGTQVKALKDHYVFGDFVTGRIGAFPISLHRQISANQIVEIEGQGNNWSSFGRDSQGELYAVSYGGKIFKFTD